MKYSQIGYGGATHYATEDFLKALGITATGVPYKSSSEAIVDILAGRIDFMFMPLDLVRQHIEAGKLTNTGYFSHIVYWNGLWVNRNAPEEMKKELRDALKAVRADLEFSTGNGKDRCHGI